MKSIQITEETWEKIIHLKLKFKLKTMEDVIKRLMKDGYSKQSK